MPINVNLTPELEGLIREKRAAKLAQLRHDIQDGLHSGPARSWNVAEMKREGRRRLATRAASGRK